jgi:hypothetical protein
MEEEAQMQNQTYEEWEIEATMGQKKWMVSDDSLPCASRHEAQKLCDMWPHGNVGITFKPVGYKVTRERISDAPADSGGAS